MNTKLSTKSKKINKREKQKERNLRKCNMGNRLDTEQEGTDPPLRPEAPLEECNAHLTQLFTLWSQQTFLIQMGQQMELLDKIRWS